MINGNPERLYKYIDSKYIERFVTRGELLFRNLSYFRLIEDAGRADLLEGLHVDWPDNPLTLEVKGKIRWQGNAGVINSINQNRILAYCLSTKLSKKLYEEFNTDACIEIINPSIFFQKVNTIVSKQNRFSETCLIHDAVKYYMPNKPAPIDINDPRQIPLCKHISYSHQCEYRLVLSLNGGLKQRKLIVNELYTVDQELSGAKPDHRKIVVGELKSIVNVHYL